MEGWGYGIVFFRARNFQNSEPEIWQKSLFLRNFRDFPGNFGLWIFFRALENGHSMRHQSKPPLSAGRLLALGYSHSPPQLSEGHGSLESAIQAHPVRESTAPPCSLAHTTACLTPSEPPAPPWSFRWDLSGVLHLWNAQGLNPHQVSKHISSVVSGIATARGASFKGCMPREHANKLLNLHRSSHPTPEQVPGYSTYLRSLIFSLC